MFWFTPQQVHEWVNDSGAIRSTDGVWALDDATGLTTNELMHELVPRALADPDLTPDDRLNLGFGLLDVFDDYAIAMHLRWEFVGADAAHARELDLVWEFCREGLEREHSPAAVEYWLWVDWFEDTTTSSESFEQMVRGIGHLTAQSGTDDPVLRRADRVLRNSGPVPWRTKAIAYKIALRIPALHAALREAIAHSEGDYFGKIEQRGVDALLKKLDAGVTK